MAYNKPTANQISLGSTTMLDDVINPAGNWIGSPTGLQGPTGAQGVNGSNGSQGATGAQGTNGSQGVQGRQGTTGTGNTGSQGATGTTGSQGANGSNGAQGANGSNGSQGATGTTGIQGATGTQGATGSGGLSGSGSSGQLTAWNGTSSLTTAGASVSGGTITATDFVISSDARLKDIRGRILFALQTIEKISGIKYSLKGEDEIQLGVIAQEIQSVLPEAVLVDDNGYLTVKYERLIPVLLEAIKEEHDLTRRLEQRVAKLEQMLGLSGT